MNLTVETEVEIRLSPEEKAAAEWIGKCLQEAARMEELPRTEVTVTLVNDESIQRLNREYRGVDRPTDVLSFPLWHPGEEWETVGEEAVPLGDIVISVPRAREQAQEYGHSLQRELGFLAVHGFLHLLGYDHGSEEEERKMFTRQEEILTRVGLKR